MSSSAVNQVLTSIPALQLQQHQANSLRMLGSLKLLSNSTASEILDNTDLEEEQYA